MMRRTPRDEANNGASGTAAIIEPDDDSKQSSTGRGLSELSKQLRALQSMNHDYIAQIDKLERKLKIMSDLKGVSVQDLKSALHSACEGEAYNELRVEVETLRAQLAIASSSKSSRGTNNSFQQSAMANMELRVGELEEVEESLRNQVSKLYQQVRQETAKSTRLESTNQGLQNQLQELQQQLQSQTADLQSNFDAQLSKLQSEIEESSSKQLEAECYVVREKERVEALRIQVAEYQGMELQLTKSRAHVQQLQETFERLASDQNAVHTEQVQEVVLKLTSMTQRAESAEKKLSHTQKKLQALEQQSANTFSLELQLAKQKVQIKELMEQSQESNLLESTRKEQQESARDAEISQLQQRASDFEAKLQAAMAQSHAFEKQASRVSQLERQLQESKDDLSAQRKKSDRYKKERDKAVTEKKTEALKEMQGYEVRLLELQEALSKENRRVAELEGEVSKVKDLQSKLDRQNKEIESSTSARAKFKESEKKLRELNEQATEQLKLFKDELLEAKMNLKMQEDTSASLQKQLASTEKEANLRKEQFESRFQVQDELLRDLNQQLSSLYTAFHMERGERSEEIRNQTVLQMSLHEADSKVAHQLHDIEENEQKQPMSPAIRETLVQSTPVKATPIRSYQSPSPGSSRSVRSITTSTTTECQPQVGLAQGYLYKKDKFKGWKKRYCFLHGNLTTGQFTMSYSDAKGKPSKGGIQGIQAAVSRVQTSNEFSKHPHAFVLRVNPYDNKAPTVYFAAASSRELDTWMTAFTMATQGIETATGAAVTVPPVVEHPVGSQVVIVDLIHHPEYNGLCGTVLTELMDDRQCVMIDSLDGRKVKLSPANLELFALAPSEDDEEGNFLEYSLEESVGATTQTRTSATASHRENEYKNNGGDDDHDDDGGDHYC